VKACTIVARNYLAHARVLAESFLEHHPEAGFSVLVIDAPSSELSGEPFEVLHPTEVGIDEQEYGRMAMIYDVLELATAVKPWLLRHLLTEDEVVVYFDPDIQVFAPLDEIESQARAHGIVLTPHTTEAAPRGSNELAENTILAAGIYNLGFIGIARGEETERFLDWWSERLARECLVDPAQGRFVDQRWVDFVPGLFDVHILRDPSYNVAWWNLANRDLVSTATGYEVNGNVLRFFHFSGYSPDDPHVLSKHQGRSPPVLLSENKALASICEQYAARLVAAGYRESSLQPYGLGRLPNGVPLDRRMRHLYRSKLVAAEDGEADEPPSLFDPLYADQFIDWLNEPADGAPVSRYLAALYSDRPDVRLVYPNPAQGFPEWVRAHGRIEEGIPSELVPGPTPTAAGTLRWKLSRRLGRNTFVNEAPPAPAPAEARRPQALLPGVNVAGYLRAELGVGEAARHLIAGIRRADLPYTTLTYSATTSRQEHDFDAERSGDPVYDTNIICVNADQILAFVDDVGRDFLSGRYTIGLWWWEIGYFPEFLHGAFDVVDEVWVGSRFVAEAVAAETSKPVHVLPLGIELPNVESLSRAQLGLPEGFLFLFSFDFLSVFERKNPLGLVEAFKRAFARGEGPTLVLKSINGDQKLSALEELRLATADRDDILVVDRYLSAAEKNALTATCDAYVSLHRSEGFGLTMAEAMALGKPVIATGYSGNLTFMNEENSYLVPHRLVPIPAGCEPYPPGHEWAEPNLEAAAALLRRVYEHREEAAAKSAHAEKDMRAHHGPNATAGFLRSRLDEISRERTSPAPERREDALARAEEYLASGPRNPISAPSRLPGGRFLRRVLFRVLRPYLVRRQELDDAVVRALRELDGQIRGARAELGERLDTLGAETRAAEEGTRRHLDAASSHLNAMDERLTRLVHELHAQPYVSDHSLLRTTDSKGREAIGFSAGERPAPAEDVYRGFEDIFRGSEEFIRRRQRLYVDVIGERQPVLDVGCGRGEFLDLLKEAGIEARGVDIDEGMVEHCREKGHNVELADANDYLERQADDSLGAIFAAQVIEHLPYEALVRFFSLAEAKLVPGAVFIAETVNPHSIPALKAFWVDPTHRNPIFPEVAAALARLAGFASGLIVFPSGTGELEEDRVTQGEYALVATKQWIGEHRTRPRVTELVAEPAPQVDDTANPRG
jgi:glycosyltransferase involved in cell wall biosynthesis/SAM-dependent methyltransferase